MSIADAGSSGLSGGDVGGAVEGRCGGRIGPAPKREQAARQDHDEAQRGESAGDLTTLEAQPAVGQPPRADGSGFSMREERGTGGPLCHRLRCWNLASEGPQGVDLIHRVSVPP